MHILKLPWLGHKGENKQIECYSVTINADGSRLASGGLDGRVKVWDTKSILSYKDWQEKKKPDKVDIDSRLDGGEDNTRRPLCSMNRHNGVVTSVKFSPDGRFLASGSDDKIVLIWEKDEDSLGQTRAFGNLEADLERWTVRKRLVAHDNDVQDICWSPDGSLLVSVGLDRSIVIWDGMTFERIKRYDIHQSMVKGIVFDPANKFFATASDDRSVRIFRYHKKLSESPAASYEFQVEDIVLEPFKKSPLTSYFRRMSWSPDGKHIAVPNATNGPVTSVAIIDRNNWSTDISLIGHEAPCEVCSFSPRLFEVESVDPGMGDEKTYTAILATAGQDQKLVVWSTSQSNPLVVINDVVSGSITDICWDPNGQIIYFSCLDGSITCLIFEDNELGKATTADINDLQLHRYGADRESAIFPESVEQLKLEEVAAKLEVTESKPQPEQPTVTQTNQARSVEQNNNNLSNTARNEPEKKAIALNQHITYKNGKKRLAPTLISSSSAPSNTTFQESEKRAKKSFSATSKLSESSFILPRLGISSAVHGIKSREHPTGDGQLDGATLDDQDNDNDDMGLDLANLIEAKEMSGQAVSETTLKRQRNKLKRAILESRYPSSLRLVSNLPVNLFNNQSVLNHKAVQILKTQNESSDIQGELISGSSIDAIDEDILSSVIVCTTDTAQVSDLGAIPEKEHKRVLTTIEVRNGPLWRNDEDSLYEMDYNDRHDFQDPTYIIVDDSTDQEHRKFKLYFPYRIQHVLPFIYDDILKYYVLVSFNGTIQVISANSGTYVTPNIELSHNVIAIKQVKEFVMCVTNEGLVYVWKFPVSSSSISLKGILNGISLAPVTNFRVRIIDRVGTSNNVANHRKVEPVMVVIPNVRLIDIDPTNGEPIVMMENSSDVFKYSIDLMCWVSIVDSWYYMQPEVDHLLPNIDCDDFTRNIINKSHAIYTNNSKGPGERSYIWDDSSSHNELKSVMRSRLEEIIALSDMF
ncbi:Piso0_000834 [Millerozyma farinosa CBS 7064]|uniref:Protein HIR n=1 Tax=Pichia sorbitophila (strain ATCC MYA-4447 / BCRC 22081 / CBS 7064 / NBRC 10061 / NRRL Y-12695) TaxID=559304 RepID=G8YQ69_PICSO|nr:Piso0_000834 [Millerozyma farinosa CBS 7064]